MNDLLVLAIIGVGFLLPSLLIGLILLILSAKNRVKRRRKSSEKSISKKGKW